MDELPEKPSNVILILTDDQGIWAAGCYGNPEIRTPNIDRLAQTGMQFENFFIATPVCSPSRATFFTGRIPSQHGVHDWIRDGHVGSAAIRYMEGEVAYTDAMVKHGIVCGMSGKWHLGDSQYAQFSFSHWYVHQRGGGPYYNAPMVRDGKLVNEPGYVTNLITNDALKFIDAYANERFYLSVHYTAPHRPWIDNHPKEIVDSYDDCHFESCPQEPAHPWAHWNPRHGRNTHESLKGYFAAVTAMDMDVGRVLDRLDELGLRNDTLVVFVSDNGYSCGHHGFWGKGNGTWPRNMFENSIKVPCIFSHPGRIPQGKVQEEMVSAYDFMPTLLDYAGLSVPETPNLPGSSFLPLLIDQPMHGCENIVVFDEYGPVRMIRTREWKYVHRYYNGPHELYDLLNDSDERRNLIDDKSQKERIFELKSRMKEWFARYVVSARDGIIDDGTDPPNHMGQIRLVVK